MRNKIKAPSKNESRMIKFMILLGIFSILNFLVFFFKPEHKTNSFLFILLSCIIIYDAMKKLYMWYNYSNISVPKTPLRTSELKVDILTTYFPGEPYQMITTTLKAIQNIRYPHTTYLCDEANDPYLKQFCEENGIKHVTRDNRIDAKAGNINNALKKYATGDICVILDPDHIPQPDFLDPILPHFEDPKMGFVQIVQSYYNIKESLVARGAAEQTFQFYGPMMMSLNSYGAVNAIGANCVFRRSALDSIGGHAPGLCEDMHTAMLLYAKGWKAVYVPEVLAKGLAPSNLTNFFKQQLKWSRGTFDLWIKVYPKIFRKLTPRQRIHYGILPMHYLSGVIILFTFLIPILSLIFSTTPWRGNIIDFALVAFPVAASSVLIRTFIQKWVIEKKERGFHIVGGLLHINTWWIYILGLIYTILNKKVPYLPTPKEDEFNTNMKIVLPNAIIAALSIFAIIYGLEKDFTPFSLVMAGFAFFNACIMLFGIYITGRVTNQNKILRRNLRRNSLRALSLIKRKFYRLANVAFTGTRAVALPLLLIILITSMSFKNENDQSKWEEVYVSLPKKITDKYLGIFQPSEDNGLSNIHNITALEQQEQLDFDIISFYLAWTDDSIENFPHSLMDSIYNKNSVPMITWEPWASTLKENEANNELQAEKKIFKYITNGHFDSYISKFAKNLSSYDKPVFLRFAHEFDNPQYPWSAKGNNTPEEFKKAWKHVHHILQKEGAEKVILVWNPWKSNGMAKYYPGDKYVDWIGLTMLNYGPLNENGEVINFSNLYQPFKDKMYWFTRKPVMLAEFGALKLGGNNQDKWLRNAVESINTNFKDISALVYFNSSLDANIPANKWYKDNHLNWTINNWDGLKSDFRKRQQGSSIVLEKNPPGIKRNPITRFDIKGVRYKKGTNWMNNYYALTKEVLSNDFKLIKEAGINTIQITGGNIYDHNLLLYSNKFDLNLVYQFNIDNTLDFIHDAEKLKELENDILAGVEDMRENDNLISYSFKYDLEEHYIKPLLFDQQTAYLKWLQSLTKKIKEIDPKKSLVVDLKLGPETINQINRIHNHLPIDSYGLIVSDDSTNLEEVLQSSKGNDQAVFISSLNSKLLIEDPEKFAGRDIVLQNWQDERKSNWISFDGLVDFRGRKKRILKNITDRWTQGEEPETQAPIIRILKPAEALYPGQIYTYHAAKYNGDEWNVTQKEDEFIYEWNLIKNDKFGNHLAIKKLGTKPKVNLLIPDDYKQYEIMLVTRKKGEDFVINTKTSLHTLAKSL